MPPRYMPESLQLVAYEEYSSLDETEIALRPGEKVVYFVRHGQSVANVARDHMDPANYDAPLTEHGQGQAKELQQHVPRWNVQAVYCSPLRRAIQTACFAFAEDSKPITAWPVVTEFWGHLPECQGHNARDLSSQLHLTSLARFEDVRMDGVYDEWWTISDDTEYRLSSFFRWLACSPETYAAVVSHWGFLSRALEAAQADVDELKLENCTWIRTVWQTNPRGAPTSFHNPRTYSIALTPSGGNTATANALVNSILKVYHALHERRDLEGRFHKRCGRPHILFGSFGPLPSVSLLSDTKALLKEQARRMHTQIREGVSTSEVVTKRKGNAHVPHQRWSLSCCDGGVPMNCTASRLTLTLSDSRLQEITERLQAFFTSQPTPVAFSPGDPGEMTFFCGSDWPDNVALSTAIIRVANEELGEGNPVTTLVAHGLKLLSSDSSGDDEEDSSRDCGVRVDPELLAGVRDEAAYNDLRKVLMNDVEWEMLLFSHEPSGSGEGEEKVVDVYFA